MKTLHPVQKKILDYLKREGELEGLTLRELGERIGVEHPYKISYHLKKLEEQGYLRLNPVNPNEYQILKNPIEDVAFINLYDIPAHCGRGAALLDEARVVKRIPISTKEFGVNANAFMVLAKGRSMEPKIHDGDYVIAQAQPDIDYSGQVALVVHNETPKIKRINKVVQRFMLGSLNPEYPDQLVLARDRFRIVGVVKGVIHFEGRRVLVP
ncbi:MAG: helix-turn-helix domain-containing protein [Candidatus Portnoybacteria bacterium]|nr:helix-turn-helix domain-containing protein [Candidatus Portnoybacteria bacterium]